MRIVFLALAIAFAAVCTALVFGGVNVLGFWFESLSPTQQYWLPKAGLAISVLLAASGAFSAYRSRQRGQDRA